MILTDTTEKGLESLIVADLVGQADVADAAFAAFHLAMPPTERERLGIIEHISAERLPINRAIHQLLKGIDLIREYRTQLIADVVTGKLDVRGVETPGDPGHTDESDLIEEDEAEQQFPADWFPEDSDE